MAVWYDELGRHLDRLRHAREHVAVGKISGAVGTFANIDPRVEAKVCRILKLKPAPASTQTLQRDRLSYFMAVLAGVGNSLEKFATEIRNLQRTEILEVEEYFAEGQKGSSAMPHKRNPWNSETVSGLARVVRGHVIPTLECMTTWHERDLANSSVERIVLPDTCALLEWMLLKFADILDRLTVFPERMLLNLERTGGLVCSEQVMLALIASGVSREEAYLAVQSNASRAWAGESFRSLISEDPLVKERLTPEEIDHAFDIRRHLQNLQHTFDKLGI
jgi:adenylosuccinate lyase